MAGLRRADVWGHTSGLRNVGGSDWPFRQLRMMFTTVVTTANTVIAASHSLSQAFRTKPTRARSPLNTEHTSFRKKSPKRSGKNFSFFSYTLSEKNDNSHTL